MATPGAPFLPVNPKPPPPEGPPNTVEPNRSEGVAFAVLMAATLLLLALVLTGCSARLGPGAEGWLMWDVCGYEGGVAAEITVMEVGARLGCTNPPEPPTDEVPEPEE